MEYTYQQPLSENPCGIPMDPGMKAMYQHIFKINPDGCLPIRGLIGELEINLSGEKIPFEDFLKSKTRIVSLDQFSTKERNEIAINKMIKESRMSKAALEVCKRLYVEVHRFWGLTEHDGKSIGIVYRLNGFNGVPRLITDLEMFVNSGDINEAYKKAFSQINPFIDAHLEPQILDIQRYAMSREFLEANPIYMVGGGKQ